MEIKSNKNKHLTAVPFRSTPGKTAIGADLQEHIKNINISPRNEKRNETERPPHKASNEANSTGTKNGTKRNKPTVPRNAPLGAYRDMERGGTKTKKTTPTQPITRPITLILPGNIRSKKNSREKHYAKTKTGRLVQFSAASKTYRAWEQRAQQAAHAQLEAIGINNPTDQTLKLTVKAFMAGNTMDLDAVHTAVMDAMEKIVWINDRQIRQFSDQSCVVMESRYPRTEIIIEPIGGRACI